MFEMQEIKLLFVIIPDCYRIKQSLYTVFIKRMQIK